MPEADPRAIDVGVRIMNLIDTGSRESTYKLAALLALCQHATEHYPRDTGSGLAVPLRREGLAVMASEIEWPAGESRMLGTARAMIAIAPLGIRLWAGRGRLEPLTEAGRRQALAVLG